MVSFLKNILPSSRRLQNTRELYRFRLPVSVGVVVFRTFMLMLSGFALLLLLAFYSSKKQLSAGRKELSVFQHPGTKESIVSVSYDTVSHTSKPAVFNLTDVDVKPEYKGGERELKRFIRRHLRYPKPAALAEIEGTCFVRFIIDEQGKINSASPLNMLGYGLDQEAMRIVKLLPPFRPALKNGNPVKVFYQLPVRFKAAYLQ